MLSVLPLPFTMMKSEIIKEQALTMFHRVALVTGASRGIGREIAQTLCKSNYDIIVASPEVENNETVAESIRACGGRAMTLNLDVSNQESVKEGVSAALKEMGRIDVLVLEGLDRLSREVGEAETVTKRLEHRGVRIVGLVDGYDSHAAGRKVLRIARGLVNELYLDDLACKTRRGLQGQLARGYHVGGVCYGYRSQPSADGRVRVLGVDEPPADVVARKSGVEGKSVEDGGRRIIKKKTREATYNTV